MTVLCHLCSLQPLFLPLGKISRAKTISHIPPPVRRGPYQRETSRLLCRPARSIWTHRQSRSGRIDHHIALGLEGNIPETAWAAKGPPCSDTTTQWRRNLIHG